MNEWLKFFYNFITGLALILSVMGLWFTVIMPGIDRWSKRFFMSFFLALIMSGLLGIIEMIIILSPYPISSPAVNLLEFLSTLLLSLPLPMLMICLLHCCGENMRSNKLLYTVIGLYAVFVGMLATTMFYDSFYYITPEKQFLRGRWFPLLILPMAVVMLINLAGTVQRRKKLSRKEYLSFLIAILPMTLVVLVHMFIDIYPLFEICMVISTLSMYGLITSDQIEQITKQQQEISHQRANIMVLQMRPHFIYNTMTSIYYLCDKDPQAAKRVTMDFTAYLRRNFTAIVSRNPIPFSDELEHTRAYLAVEQMQFEDSLLVEYDTPHTNFRVPPLTLQPIVENAVKHGMDPESAPLRISIRTCSTDSGSEIIVEDNGPGFDPAEYDESEPHIALYNIRQRLEMMCGGEMVIMPRDGGGTVLKVTIPE